MEVLLPITATMRIVKFLNVVSLTLLRMTFFRVFARSSFTTTHEIKKAVLRKVIKEEMK